jgi:hypothetical protein
MAQPIPRHPSAVVLRPHGLRTLVVVAVVALVLAVAAAVAAVVADDDGGVPRTSSPVPERVTDAASQRPG